MLREKLRSGKHIMVGSIWDPLSARIYQRAGFDAVNVGSYTVAGSLGVPDVGLITWMDSLEMIRKVSSLCNLPVMVDGEQGFGYENLTAHIFGEFERAGASVLRIDDMGDGMKCPHLGTPPVCPMEETVDKIKTVIRHRKSHETMIIARSVAGYKYDFNETLERLKAYRDAGAEILWPSTWKREDLERAKKVFPDVPLCISLTPFKKRTYAGMTVRQAMDMGYQLMFFAATIFLRSVKAGLEAATKLVETGDPFQVWPEGYWEDEFLDLIDLPKWTQRDI